MKKRDFYLTGIICAQVEEEREQQSESRQQIGDYYVIGSYELFVHPECFT
jgi:hypothetical protein